MTPQPQPVVAGRGWTIALGLVVPVVICLATMGVLWSWLDDLPGQIAVHWGPHGVDGFASPTSAVWFQLLTLIIPLLATALGVWRGYDAMTRRMCVTVSLFTSVFISALQLVLVGMQRGLVDTQQVGDADPAILSALAVGVAAAAAGWFAMPGDPPSGPGHVDPHVDHINVGPRERVMWTRTVHNRVPVLLVVVIFLGTAAVLWFAEGGYGVITVCAVCALVALIAAVFSSVRVTVDGSGLTVRFGPLRARHIPAANIAHVEAVEVDPLRQFGGWGVRTNLKGVVGVVMRKGPGIETTTADGRRFVVTVPDAATGAALLAGVALRVQGTRGERRS